MELTGFVRRLKSISHLLTHLLRPFAQRESDPVPDPQDTFEASRSEKLRRIEELGIDPWGGRFDGHQAIGAIRDLPHDAQPSVRVRAAGRIVLRRGQGKVAFVDLWDWSGKIQVMIGQKQVGEIGWKLAQELDLGDLLGVDGEL